MPPKLSKIFINIPYQGDNGVIEIVIELLIKWLGHTKEGTISNLKSCIYNVLKKSLLEETFLTSNDYLSWTVNTHITYLNELIYISSQEDAVLPNIRVREILLVQMPCYKPPNSYSLLHLFTCYWTLNTSKYFKAISKPYIKRYNYRKCG